MPSWEPKPKLEAVDDQRLTVVDVLNPSIALLDSSKSLKVLLSRNTLIDQHAIHLRGVRLIEIPRGWRLMFIRLVSRLLPMRLPDEIEFDSLRIETRTVAAPLFDGETIIGSVNGPSSVIQLTGSEYLSLCQMNGRTMHRWVAEHFNLHMGTKRVLPGDWRAAA